MSLAPLPCSPIDVLCPLIMRPAFMMRLLGWTDIIHRKQPLHLPRAQLRPTLLVLGAAPHDALQDLDCEPSLGEPFRGPPTHPHCCRTEVLTELQLALWKQRQLLRVGLVQTEL